MSRSERRFANTVPKSNPKPSPFSSLLSLKNRRAGGDTSAISDTSPTEATEHSETVESGGTSLPPIQSEPPEQPVAPDIQAFAAIEQLVTPTLQASAATAHPVPPAASPVQMPEAATQPLDLDSQTAGRSTQSLSPPVRLSRTSGVTSPTAVSLAQNPLGKRSRPDYTRMTVYVRKAVHDEFNLVTNLAREEMSEIVERLIEDYAKSRKKELVRSLVG